VRTIRGQFYLLTFLVNASLFTGCQVRFSEFLATFKNQVYVSDINASGAESDSSAVTQPIVMAGLGNEKQIRAIFIHSDRGAGASACSTNLNSRTYCSHLIRRYLWSQLQTETDVLPFCEEGKSFQYTDTSGSKTSLTCQDADLRKHFDVRIFVDRNYSAPTKGFVNTILGPNFFDSFSNDTFVLRWIPESAADPISSKGALIVAGKTSLATNYASTSFLERGSGVLIGGPPPAWLWDPTKWWTRSNLNPLRPAFGCIGDCPLVPNLAERQALTNPNHPNHQDYPGIAGPLDHVPTIDRVAIAFPKDSFTIIEVPSVQMREFSASSMSPFFRVALLGQSNHSMSKIFTRPGQSGFLGPYRANPRYYSPSSVPANGSVSWQPCMYYPGDGSNDFPSTIDIVSDFVLDQFQSNDIVKIGQNDSNLTMQNMCLNDLERINAISNQSGIDQKEIDTKKIAFLYYRWIDEIATAVRRKARDKNFSLSSKRILVLYYAWTAAEIDNAWKQDPLIITSVTLDSSTFFEHSQLEEMIHGERSRIKEASRRFHEFGVYEYLHGIGFAIPRVYNKLLSTSIQSNYTRSIYDKSLPTSDSSTSQIRAFYAETYPNWGIDCSKVWLAAKLLWNQKASYEALEEYYYKTLYGDQSSSVRYACRILEESWTNNNWDNAHPSLKFRSNYRGFSQIRQLLVSDLSKTRKSIKILENAMDQSSSPTIRARLQYFIESLILSVQLQERFRIVAEGEAQGIKSTIDIPQTFHRFALWSEYSGLEQLLQTLSMMNGFTSNFRMISQWNRYWYMFGADYNEMITRISKQALSLAQASINCFQCEIDEKTVYPLVRTLIDQAGQQSNAPKKFDAIELVEDAVNQYGVLFISDRSSIDIFRGSVPRESDWSFPFFSHSEMNASRAANEPQRGFNLEARDTENTNLWVSRHPSLNRLIIAFETPVEVGAPVSGNSLPTELGIWLHSRSDYENLLYQGDEYRKRVNNPRFKLFHLRVSLSGAIEIRNELNQPLDLMSGPQKEPVVKIIRSEMIATQGSRGMWRGEIHLELGSKDLSFLSPTQLNSCNPKLTASTHMNLAFYTRKHPSQLPRLATTVSDTDLRHVSSLAPIANWANNPGPFNSAVSYQLLGGPILIFKNKSQVPCDNSL